MTKILIADDEPNILMLTELLFKEMGMTVFTAKDGEEAITIAAKEKPDMIITDVIMPNKNGFEVCQAIRNNPSISNTPIIILSALGDEYNKITGFEEGADDYITKPFNIEELKTRSKNLLLRYQSRKQSDAIATATTQPPELNVQIDRVATNTPALNDALYGGLPKGSNILLLGPTGMGKSTFARNFIYQGLQNSEKCLFITLDDDPKKIREQLNQNAETPVNEYEHLGFLRFVDAYSWSSLAPTTTEKFSINGILELNQLAGVIADASAELGHTVQNKLGGRRVIDSISSLLINFELPAVQRFLNQIARTTVSFGGVTTFFLMEKNTVPETVLNNVKYIMDGIIEFDRIDNQKSIRVASMKWAQYKNDWILQSTNPSD